MSLPFLYTFFNTALMLRVFRERTQAFDIIFYKEQWSPLFPITHLSPLTRFRPSTHPFPLPRLFPPLSPTTIRLLLLTAFTEVWALQRLTGIQPLKSHHCMSVMKKGEKTRDHFVCIDRCVHSLKLNHRLELRRNVCSAYFRRWWAMVYNFRIQFVGFHLLEDTDWT